MCFTPVATVNLWQKLFSIDMFKENFASVSIKELVLNRSTTELTE